MGSCDVCILKFGVKIIWEWILKGKMNKGSCIWQLARGRSRSSWKIVTVVYVAIWSRIEAKKFRKTSEAESYIGAISRVRHRHGNTRRLCGYRYGLGNLYPWLYHTHNCDVMGISQVFQVESKIPLNCSSSHTFIQSWFHMNCYFLLGVVDS